MMPLSIARPGETVTIQKITGKDEVRQHLLAEHGFTLQCEGSILYGLCRQCAEKQRQAQNTPSGKP